MPLNVSTALALFLGLGGRILINTLARTQGPTAESSLPDFVLLGAWQGEGLYYALMEFPGLSFVAAFAIGAKLLVEFTLIPDVVKCAVTLLGVAMGVMFTDVLSQFLEDGSYSKFGGTKKSGHDSSRRPRTMSFSRSKGNEPNPSRRDRERERERDRDRIRSSHADITAPSLDSTSDWIDRTARTPLDREVAILRARASLADTEKRRYKEERIWALAAGNQARAEQMSWQVKRYRALTHGFNKEADAKLLEGVYLSAIEENSLCLFYFLRVCSKQCKARSGSIQARTYSVHFTPCDIGLTTPSEFEARLSTQRPTSILSIFWQPCRLDG